MSRNLVRSAAVKSAYRTVPKVTGMMLSITTLEGSIKFCCGFVCEVAPFLLAEYQRENWRYKTLFGNNIATGLKLPTLHNISYWGLI
jgi:hypothetical protein